MKPFFQLDPAPFVNRAKRKIIRKNNKIEYSVLYAKNLLDCNNDIHKTNHQNIMNIMTDVEIIDVDSDAFFSGHYHLTAIIKVTCRGHYVPEIWDSVSGIYRIRIDPNPANEANQVSVELLTGKILATGKIN